MKRRLISLLLCLFALSVLSGCVQKTQKTAPSPVYGTKTVKFYEEPGSFFLSKAMDTAETAHALYCFDPLISEEQQQDVLLKGEALLSALTTPLQGLTLCFYAPETYAHTYISGHTLYTCLTEDFPAKILLTLTEGSGHYGTAYGLSALLFGEGAEASPAFPTETALLDLNLLCFDSAFAAEEDIAALQSLSIDFARFYADRFGQQALEALCFTAPAKEISEALSAYYASLGTAYTPAVLPFVFGGEGYAYGLLREEAAFYVEAGWQDLHRDKNPLVYDGFLLKNYGDLQAFFATVCRQMEQYRELFALEKYKEGVQVFFPKSTSTAPLSYYNAGTHCLYIYNTDSLMHEYIHALTRPTPTMSLWETEGFARFYSCRYDAYGLAFLNADYNSLPDTPETRYVHEYLEAVGRPIDMAAEHETLEDIAVYSRGYTDPNDSYAAGSSFVGYLVREFGDAAVIDAIYGTGTPLPRPMEALVQEWQDYLQTTYSAYSLYTP